MQPFPHHYRATVTAGPKGQVEITSPGLKPLTSEPPREFDGPGTLWSPETLLVAAVADCLALTFRAIAGINRFSWTSLTCTATGTLNHSDEGARFTALKLYARLSLPAGADPTQARKILEKAEKACLIGNSLKCVPVLEVQLTFDAKTVPISA